MYFCLGLVIFFSKVPLKFIFRGLKPIFIILFTFTVNMFMTKGEHWQGSGFDRYERRPVQRFLHGAQVGASDHRLFHAYPDYEAHQPYRRYRAPVVALRSVGVPAHELAMMMTIALRFIPTLLEETDKIMKAQMARGADFETGNLLCRAKA